MEKRKKGEQDMSDDIITQLKQWTALSFKQKKKVAGGPLLLERNHKGFFGEMDI